MKKLAGAVNCRYLLSLRLSILFVFLIGAGILAVRVRPCLCARRARRHFQRRR